MNVRNNCWFVAGSVAALILGATLSRMIEPGVRVEKIVLATNTPALRIFPTSPGMHPKALLAHGNGGSKEMFFRFGEALAVAGFDCYSVDQAGYGESPQSCSRTNVRRYFVEAERALGPVDVFNGHSMGGGTGSWSVREAGFRPKLFIGTGYPAKLGEHGPPLLLAGLFEEFFRPAELRAVTNARVVISPWSEHILEVYDPVLVRAGVEAACAAVGKPVPTAPTRAWRWRFAGLLLGIAGALVLMFCLPEIHPRLARIRGFIIPGVLLLALGLTLGTWVGVTPQLRRIPYQLILMPVIWLTLAGLNKLRLSRWSLAVLTALLALACLTVAHCVAFPQFEKGFFLAYTLFCTLGLSTLLLLPSTLVGKIASRGGSGRDGDVAVAIFASYVIGQFMPMFY